VMVTQVTLQAAYRRRLIRPMVDFS
jgi:hypothetical protein